MGEKAVLEPETPIRLANLHLLAVVPRCFSCHVAELDIDRGLVVSAAAAGEGSRVHIVAVLERMAAELQS